MPFTLPAFIVNGLMLLLALVMAIIITRSGAIYQYNQGFPEIQGKMRDYILRSLVALIILGVVAAVFNLVWSVL